MSLLSSVEKLNLSSTSEAHQLYKNGYRANFWNTIVLPLAVFIKFYFLKGNVFKGKNGFILSWLSAYERFLIHAKLWELINISSENSIEKSAD